MADFAATVAAAYATDGPALDLGRGVDDGAVAAEAVVQVPLAMLNRHGLVAGATGTGTTKTLQLMAEGLSAAGVPVFVADVKGEAASPLAGKDATRLERESGLELLAARMTEPEAEREPAHVPAPKRRPRRAPAPSDAVGDFLTSRQGKALQRQVLRGVFGMLRTRL